MPIEGRGLYFEKDSCGFSGGEQETGSPTSDKLSLEAFLPLPTWELGRTRPLADLWQPPVFYLDGGLGTKTAP